MTEGEGVKACARKGRRRRTRKRCGEVLGRRLRGGGGGGGCIDVDGMVSGETRVAMDVVLIAPLEDDAAAQGGQAG